MALILSMINFLEYLTKVIDMSALEEIVQKVKSATDFLIQPMFLSTVPGYGIKTSKELRGKSGIHYDKMAQDVIGIDNTTLELRGNLKGDLDDILDDLNNITSVRMHRAVSTGNAIRKQVLSLTDDYNDYNQALNNYTNEMKTLETDFCNAMDVWQ